MDSHKGEVMPMTVGVDGVIATLGALWLGLLSWIGHRFWNQLDSKAGRDEVEDAVSRIETKVDALIASQTAFNLAVSSDVARIQGANGHK